MAEITGGTQSPASPDSEDLGKGQSTMESYDALKALAEKLQKDLTDITYSYTSLKHDYEVAKKELVTIKSSELYRKVNEIVEHVVNLLKSHSKLSPASAIAQVDSTILDKLAALIK